MKNLIFSTALVLAATISSCNKKSNSEINNYSISEIDSLKGIITQLTLKDKQVQEHLKTFDDLDFEVFSNQEWSRLHESHSKDIKVYWPDGHSTEGIEIHLEDMKKLFVHAPDTRIKMHPIKFGSENFTAVIGVFEGTFTKPMPIGGGKFIQPTGKAFKMPMATIGIWGKDGTMIEEHLFWDNQTYANQIGIGQ
tara:strand:- start:38530 stop:39111 length:582 start_codon:yes stop_codon:yes gene_type:complete